MNTTCKPQIVCPACGRMAQLVGDQQYYCYYCDWESRNKTANVAYCDLKTTVLSPLFPHKFKFSAYGSDEVVCPSMDSLLQSLKVQDPVLQKCVCENYSGSASALLHEESIPNVLYWNGQVILRDSDDYTAFITRAYDCMFKENMAFRALVLPRFKDCYIISSIRSNDKTRTLLTEDELVYQLRRLIAFVK